jgi:sporulation protein YlmC with PRC-barrel domain
VPEIRAPAAEVCSESLAQARVIARFRPTAWLRLDLARTAVNRKDMNVADEQIAAAGHTVTGAFSTAASADVAPADNAIRPDQIRVSEMIGELIFDVSDRKLGNVVDIVLDPDGTVGAFVIGMRGGNGAVVKQLAVSMAGLKSDNDHQTLDRTPDQLQQAASYQLERGNATQSSGSSGNAATPSRGSGSMKPPPEDDPAEKYRPGRRQ